MTKIHGEEKNRIFYEAYAFIKDEKYEKGISDLLLKNRQEEEFRVCPSCALNFPKAQRKCHHCGTFYNL